MTRLEIVQQIIGVLRRSDCSLETAQSFLEQGIRRIERQLRTPAMEAIAHITATSPMHSVTIPDDLLQIIDVIANGMPLDKLPHRDLIIASNRCTNGYTAVCAPGCPQAYSRFSTGIYFYPPLQAGGDVLIAYFRRFPDLVSDDDSNAATETLTELVTYAALTYAADYFRHDEAQNWSDKYDQLLSEAQDEATQLDATGGSMSVMPAYRT